MTFTYQDYSTINVDGKRIYQISDEKYYPSITTILGQTLLSEKKNYLDAWKARVGNAKAKQITDDACTRGTNTHLMLERYLRGEDPGLAEFPETHGNIFKSLRLELKKITKVYGQEVVLYSDMLAVAGRCDLIAEYQGILSIVDYKTSSRVKSKEEIGDYWLQCAAYLIMHNEMFGTEIENMIILMGVENKLPMVFKKTITEELVEVLFNRVTNFYSSLQ